MLSLANQLISIYAIAPTFPNLTGKVEYINPVVAGGTSS
jgi:hypothetical protein